MATINAYPLQCPLGWKRAQATREAHFGRARKQAIPFQRVTMAEACQRVLEELQRMAIGREDIVISTNVRTRLDGMPRGDQAAPGDVGAAVYWQEADDTRRVMAIDQYDRVEDNIAAIAATLEAMRAIERHGGAVILERAFTGFTALPAPASTRDWWDVLHIPRDSTRDQVKAAYRRLASINHPDKPSGSHAAMATLNAAQDAALLEIPA